MSRIGLCCIHVGLQERGHKFQTMTYKRFSDLGADNALPILAKRYENNLQVLKHILNQCSNSNWCYRVSSDMFPLLTYSLANLSYENLPNRETLDSLFYDCAKLISAYKIRISCHPDQFNVLASENQTALDRTIVELEHHGWLMTKLGAKLSHESPINIHVNSNKGNTVDIAERFAKTLSRLSDNVITRLVVENEDKGIWNVCRMIEDFHKRTQLPITFDYLHHKCNNDGMTEQEAFEACYATWGRVTPLFHYSESLPEQKNPRKHADFPTAVPNRYDRQVDLDYEFKMKDLALARAEFLQNVNNKIADTTLLV